MNLSDGAKHSNIQQKQPSSNPLETLAVIHWSNEEKFPVFLKDDLFIACKQYTISIRLNS